jgi:hypothetical protein
MICGMQKAGNKTQNSNNFKNANKPQSVIRGNNRDYSKNNSNSYDGSYHFGCISTLIE